MNALHLPPGGPMASLPQLQGYAMDSLRDAETEDLLHRVRAGDQDAWADLTQRYTNLLWSVARSLRLSQADAADAVQTTWLRLVEQLDNVREPDKVGSWLATTMRRECLAALRRNGRIRVTTLDEWDGAGMVTDPLDEALLRQERDAALWRAFTGLSPRCQSLLRVLMADPPPRYAEVAAALDMPVGSIGPTRQRCLEALRRIMLPGAQPTPSTGGL